MQGLSMHADLDFYVNSLIKYLHEVHILFNYIEMYFKMCISLLLSTLLKLPGSFE